MPSDTDEIAVCIKLAFMPVRASLAAAEAVGREMQNVVTTRDVPNSAAVTETQVEAAALAIKAKLIESRDLGYQCIVRTNLPPDVIREVARAALEAASAATAGAYHRTVRT